MPHAAEYLVALGVGLASGLLPIVNVEAYLVGLALLAPAEPPWLLAAPAAAGQVAGKLVYYYAARGSLRLPAFLRAGAARARPLALLAALARGPYGSRGAAAPDGASSGAHDGALSAPGAAHASGSAGSGRRYAHGLAAAVARWSRRSARRAARWRSRAEARPHWCLGMVGVSAFAGLPPFGVMSAVAGGVRVRVGGYLLVGLPARWARFSLLLLAPGLAAHVAAAFGLR